MLYLCLFILLWALYSVWDLDICAEVSTPCVILASSPRRRRAVNDGNRFGTLLISQSFSKVKLISYFLFANIIWEKHQQLFQKLLCFKLLILQFFYCLFPPNIFFLLNIILRSSYWKFLKLPLKHCIFGSTVTLYFFI